MKAPKKAPKKTPKKKPPKPAKKTKLKALIRKKSSISKKASSSNTAIDDIFKDWMGNDSPGMALAVRQNGHVVFRNAYGMADLDHGIANRPDTVFHAASLTKQFTAMAIMMLIDDPSLATTPITLNTNVNTSALIPELAGITQANGATRQPITIGQLLHHISGIRDQWVLATMAGWRLSDDVVKQEDVMKRFVGLSKSLNFAPGSRYSYSNTNYTIAAEIVRKVSGHSLSAFCEQHIFKPLGMKKTKIIETHGEIVEDRAYGYWPVTGAGWQIRMPNYDLTGPTNLQTTVDDLMLWDANFDTMTVGGAAALTAMQTKAPTSRDYGLGLFILNQNGIKVVEHNGRDAGYRSHLIRFPDQNLSIALLANTNLVLPNSVATDTFTLVRKVAEVFLGTLLPTPTGSSASTMPGATPPNLGEFTGQFHSDELDVTYTLSLNPNGTAVQVSREKYVTVTLSPLVSPDTFRTVPTATVPPIEFSNVLPKVKFTFFREQGQIAGFSMDDISGQDQLSSFKFEKVS
jgi:CubicO group peptidase (beta-lactamase class C family)